MKTASKTRQILTVMSIVAWVAFVGYLIEAGAISFSYFISIVNPDASKNLYKGLDLFNLRQYNGWHYSLAVLFMVAASIMKSIVAFLVIRTLSTFNINKPFTMEVANSLEKVSSAALSVWLITMLANLHSGVVMQLDGKIHLNWVSGEFIFMVALVYVISQVFKRGVELQSENELTV